MLYRFSQSRKSEMLPAHSCWKKASRIGPNAYNWRFQDRTSGAESIARPGGLVRQIIGFGFKFLSLEMKFARCIRANKGANHTKIRDHRWHGWTNTALVNVRFVGCHRKSGRASRTRTCDLQSPRRTRYQAAPWPEISLLMDFNLVEREDFLKGVNIEF